MGARRERLPALAGVALAHAAIIAWLASSGPVVRAAVTAPALVLEPIASSRPMAEAIEAWAPEPLTFAEPEAPDLPTIAEEAEGTGAAASPAGGCAPFDDLSAALAADAGVRAALDRVPEGARTVTGAIVVWNAGWEDIAAAEAPLLPVRSVVERRLRAMPDACLRAIVAGPRLLPVPSHAGTSFLVFGSGRWRWMDVLNG